ncbi:hypothetical protein K6U15_24325 [Vibrio parahaemolyticus]|uniref:hypothetical protein n=1 Tax=Vibrio parahaemolyticus TaxID=670 RepID=UPI001EE9E79D|nr:hypothetical protein [Vibrio parahaemolyticus]
MKVFRNYLTKIITSHGCLYYVGSHYGKHNDNYIGSGDVIRAIKSSLAEIKKHDSKFKILHRRFGKFNTRFEMEDAETELIAKAKAKYGELCINKAIDSGCFDSEKCRETAYKLLEEGKHNFQKPEVIAKAKDASKKRTQEMLEDGTHAFKWINQKKIEDGTHHLLGSEHNRKRVENGTHNFVGRKPWNMGRVIRSERLMTFWGRAVEIYERRSSTGDGCIKLTRWYNEKYRDHDPIAVSNMSSYLRVFGDSNPMNCDKWVETFK